MSSGTVSSGILTHRKEIETILSTFPPGIEFAFGYGSGVFQQQQHSSRSPQQPTLSANSSVSVSKVESNPMIDIILVVSDSELWHAKNLSLHPDHYAFIPKMLGKRFVKTVQDWGAGLYFHPMVPIVSCVGCDSEGSWRDDKSRLVKYGVISKDRFKKDLTEWDSLYCAGRMQKPILPLDMSLFSPSTKMDDSCFEKVMNWQECNLRHALSTSLLLQNPSSFRDSNSFALSTIFQTIAGLSYIGDPRLTAGAEDPDKIRKLVHSNGQLDRFVDMFSDELNNLQHLGVVSWNKSHGNDNGRIQINLRDGATREVLYKRIPRNLQSTTRQFVPQSSKGVDILIDDAKIGASCKALTMGLARIVGPPARIQSVKGVITAGIYKSFVYASAKFAKGALRGVI